MIERGVVHNVDSATLGSYLAVDAASSATSITVDLAVDFNEDGGSLSLNGDEYTYAAADADTGVITGLSPGLTGAALEGDRVDVLPVGVVKRAYVMAEHAEDSLTVRVPHTLMPLMVDGIRVEGEREVIQFDRLGDEFVITDLVGKEPVIDGATIDPTTLPPNPSDGLAPASSPTPAVAGGIRQFFLTWTPVANADPVTYDVHLSTVAGFTAVSGNLIGSTEGSTFVIQVENPDYAISYYMRIVARDADGSAAAGAEVASALVPINSPDLAANVVRANHILAGEVRGVHFASDLLTSGVIQTASSGRRVKISLDGIQLIESDDSLLVDLSTVAGEISSFYGQLQTTALTSLDNFEMRGATNEQAVGSTYTLSAGVGASATPPVATVSYPMTATTLDHTLYKTRGVDWGSTYNFYVRRFFSDTELLRETIVGPTYASFSLITQELIGHGVAICNDSGASEDRAYVLAYNDAAMTWLIRKYDITAFPSVTIVTDYPWTHDTGVAYFAPNIGRDFGADNFITAEVLANQTQIRFRRYAANNGSLVSTTTSASMGTSLSSMPDKGIRGVSRGTFGLGLGDLYMVAFVDRVWFFDVGTGAFIASPGIGPAFFTNSSQNAFQWSSGSSKFKGHNNDDSQVTTYTDWNPTGNHTDTIWTAYTWYDSAGTTHETTMSAQKSFTMKKRAQVTISTPEIPGAGGADDPNAVRIYCGGPSATALARTSMWDQATQPGTGVTAITYQTLRLATGGGAVNPPAANNFTASAPAVWRSGGLAGDSVPYTQFLGDGSGRAEQVVFGQWAVATGDISTPGSAAWGNVTGFTFEAVAGAVYAIDCSMFCANPLNSAVDIRFGFSWTGTGEMWKGDAGGDINLTGPNAYNGSWSGYVQGPQATSPLDANTGFGIVANEKTHAMIRATYFCATSGTVQLRFRQDTSHATHVSTVKKGSRMHALRIS